MRFQVAALVITAVSTAPFPLAAQQAPSPPATVTLGELQRAAIASDPRSRQLAWLDAQSALRERNVQATRLPGIRLDGQAQHQTDVPEAPLRLPSGEPVFAAPKTTYDTSVRIEQRLFDPVRERQVAVERAQLTEQRARVQTALYDVRHQVSSAFFAAYALQERMQVINTSMVSLSARRTETEARVAAGTALRADLAEVQAAELTLRQDSEALASQQRGVFQQLEMLTGRPFTTRTPLAVPDPEQILPTALSATSRGLRPELAQLAGTRARLARQAELVDAQQRPQVSAFGRLGYGRPGLNFIADRFDLYGVVGLQVQWRPFTWGSGDREREVLRLQQQIVEADEEAFTRTLNASMPNYIYPIQRLAQALQDDDRIIALREEVERTANVRQQAGVITMSEYIARNSELMQARAAQAARRVELAQKAAEMFDVTGVEIP